MIEIRRLPGRSRVALLASLGELKGDVIRVVCLLEVGQVTAHAGRRRPLVLSSGVAGSTVQGCVHSG